MTTGTTCAAPADHDRRLATVSEAARRMYDAENALHIARQAGVGAWISAAYDRLSEATADHARAIAALQAGARHRNHGRPVDPQAARSTHQ